MDEDVTRPLVQVAPPPVATLQLCFGEAQYACGRERPVVRFGRSRDNDVVVIDDFASRRHGEIMHRSGRFFVTDHSSNGTLLMRASGHSTHFQGETFALDGSGTLRCGHRDGPAIAFVVVAPTALPSGRVGGGRTRPRPARALRARPPLDARQGAGGDQGLRGTVLKTSLSHDDEQRLQAALSSAKSAGA